MAEGKPRKIGILGGSFDPVHNGHITLAQSAIQELNLQSVIFLPARKPPHKNELKASSHARLAMLRLAVAKNKRLVISRHELNQSKTAYTKNTIQHFKRVFPYAHIYFIIGEDSLRDMHSWRNGYALLEQCNFVVGLRPGVVLSNTFMRKKVIILKQKMPAISATDIRERVEQRKSVAGVVPCAVLRYIKKKKLYN